MLDPGQPAPTALLTYGLKHHWLPELFQHLPDEFWHSLTDPCQAMAQDEYASALKTLHDAQAPNEEWQSIRDQIAQRVAAGIFARLNQQKAKRHDQAAPAAPWPTAALRERAKALLPYALSPAQQRATRDIEHSLGQNYPMRQLLQGDVGCGKTAVAFLAACQVIAAGYQVIWLAPTGVVAAQHAQWCQDRWQTAKAQAALLTGDSAQKESAQILSAWREGTLALLIGTHALLQHADTAARLGLAICDEEHKFGVEQRQQIMPRHVHALSMSATPIPRSLALGQWGAWDWTTIDQLPAGRPGVRTQVERFSKRALAAYLSTALKENQRIFVVAARKETGPVSAVALRDWMHQRGLPAGDILSGSTDLAASRRMLDNFRRGTQPIIISTSVIEIGVDIPEASMIVIVEAERFGLAQNHQLRGRVGRGDLPGHCIVMPTTQEGCDRLQILAHSSNGWDIAQADLALRGAGHLEGTTQSGTGLLHGIDLARDAEVLATTTADPNCLALLPTTNATTEQPQQ
jgi:ATP-dependent DNA helicase RecG